MGARPRSKEAEKEKKKMGSSRDDEYDYLFKGLQVWLFPNENETTKERNKRLES